MNNINIIHWNCNSITNKLIELQNFTKNHKTDIILLNETHLSPKNHLKLSNYITYRNDIPIKKGTPPHGGTAILVHRSIVHHPVNLNTSLQSTSNRIKTNNTEITVSAYLQTTERCPKPSRPRLNNQQRGMVPSSR